MKKLVQGILDFRKNKREQLRDTFARLALGQKPDVLMIACSDSRVVPNLFASTDPGDLFVVRNVGNFVPPRMHEKPDFSVSEGAALEFSLHALPVKHIIICGHSECGAMIAITQNRQIDNATYLMNWLDQGKYIDKNAASRYKLSRDLSPHNQLSQLNVLQQVEHMKTYPIVQQRLQDGSLKIHPWWFDIANADVYCFNDATKRFEVIDEENPVYRELMDPISGS